LFAELGQQHIADGLYLVVHRARLRGRALMEAQYAGSEHTVAIGCANDIDEEELAPGLDIKTSRRPFGRRKDVFADKVLQYFTREMQG
jgi:hypothetical protein